jgi:DNA-binding NarL/FixJ family response regulator
MTPPVLSETIRVLCVDDHEFVREGIALKINLEPDMHVVAAAATGEEAISLFQRHKPHVTLMDLNLPSLSGLEAIRAIRSLDRDARIVVLTMYQGDEDIYRALQAGATTYLLKGTLSGDLIRIIREVYAGGRPIPPDVAAQLAGRVGQTALSRRETEVVELMAKGLRNKEIAADLGLSEETVRNHAKSIFAKLNVADRTAAVTVSLRRGIIHID